MEARPFQAALLDKARSAIRDGARRILIQLPTGGGKTFIAALIMRGMVGRQKRSWFIAHRKELLEQTSETFGKVGLDHGWIASSRGPDPAQIAQLVGIQYAVRRLDGLDAPVGIITDECHHAVSATYTKVYEQYPDALQIGLSATPERLDGRGLGDVYDVLVQGPQTAWLIENGYLSPYRYYAPGQPDLTGVRTRAGDYAKDEVSSIMGDAKLIGDAVDHYRELANGEQGITFGVDVAHSKQIAQAFNDAGIAAEHLDGTTPDRVRADMIARFRRGELKILCNVDLFGEGFDVPNITYLGMFRPTQSLGLCMQQWGRSLRAFDGKQHAIICDHAGNAFRHGLPDDVRKWTLQGHREKGKQRESDAVSIHTCPECYTVTASVQRRCPCGYLFPVQERNPAWAEGELFELSKDQLRKQEVMNKAAQRKAEEQACKSQSDFYDLALARGYQKPAGWARMKMRQRSAAKRGIPPQRFWRGRK